MGNVTKNMYAYETDTEILLVDCGIGFPESSMLGIDLLIPDVSYLLDKKDKIVGMLLTHGHDDHIAALPYILPKLPSFPIYASRLTAGFAADRCKDSNLDPHIQEITGQDFTIGSFHITPVRVTHSIPDTRHFAIRVGGNVIYHGSDFKLDPTPVDGIKSELDKIAKIGQEGVTLALLDCLRVERGGRSLSETALTPTFERELTTTAGKFIVTVMSSNIHRIQQIVDTATAADRSVAFLGRSLEQNVQTAQRLGLLHLPQTIVNKRRINKVDPNTLCVVIAGSQGQEGSSLARAALNEHDLIDINPEDKVVFSTEPIPGNETNLYETIDNVARLGANLSYADADETMHVSGHASRDEINDLITLLKPQYHLPIGGAYRHMVQYRKLATSVGYKPEKVFLLSDGDTLTIADGIIRKGPTVALKNIMVDGLGVGDVGTVVLHDRRQMAESGIMVIVILLDAKTGRVHSEPEIISRGFVYMKHAHRLVSKINTAVKGLLPKELKKEAWTDLKKRIESTTKTIIFQETERQPLVLPVIRQV